ncbi:Mitochondrial import receptor subunit [Parasponia andersonii]|uniref:Mitochondrial import receptor subunit n=1 Tax=Parasponia andersonii TaxID=3476 RepID=A0A2P5AJH7_PARAD|nr:Mitochondrial import receptor subunit [Parasponia andersonii]
MDQLFKDLDRLCKTAEDTYADNPLDADNLTTWAGALVDLGRYQGTARKSGKMTKDAISKLEEALLVKPKKHDTICLLGKAHGFLALYTPDLDKATEYFVKATEYIQQAIDMEPENELYRESLRTVDLIHEVRYQFYGDGLGYPGIVAAGPSSSSGSKVMLETFGGLNS